MIYRAHRLAFLYMKGYIPKLIDHKDRNGLNNKWNNLREANKSTNGADKSLRKVFCFDIDEILSYFIIDFDTSDYKDVISS